MDAWVPVGHSLTSSTHAASLVAGGADWQIWSVKEGGRALLAAPALADTWRAGGLAEPGDLAELTFGDHRYALVDSGSGQTLAPLGLARSPGSLSEAMAFALALKASRALEPRASFDDAIYVERLSRLLPLGMADATPDDGLVLGAYLTGGLRISAVNVARISGVLSWLTPAQISQIVAAAGLAVLDGPQPPLTASQDSAAQLRISPIPEGVFELPGRPALATFFNDHVVDLVQNRDHYRSMGIGNPGAVILEGPPGSGKTFAVDALVSFLGWPKFSIDAETVASPYIHETSRKVNDVFQQAIRSAPSVVVIDEMEAFLSERDAALGGHHKVEEVAEFLRRIPEAIVAGVLIVAMTNKIQMIDAAIRRRGRFDHIVHVGLPDEEEVHALLTSLLAPLPTSRDVDIRALAVRLAGRPLSDAAFVVREAARLSAKARQASISQAFLLEAAAAAPGRDEARQKIGFV